MTQHNVTLRRFLSEQRIDGQPLEFADLLLDIVLGCEKVVAEIRRFGLSQYQGLAGRINVQEEEVHRLDDLADSIFTGLCLESRLVCAVGTEESESIRLVPSAQTPGPFLVMIDPLDGFSNIEVNVNIGTIFSIRRRVTVVPNACLTDFLQPGSDQVCAGYLLYGPAMVFVFSFGQGVHEFTYDATIGDFFLSRPRITIPNALEKQPGRQPCLSVNEGYQSLWDERTKAVIGRLKELGYSGRHIGSLVADFHRNLLTGGIFAYPTNRNMPQGKLRLLCELFPLAFLIEQAGGKASDGQRPILSICPRTLHQRSPVYLGSSDTVDLAEQLLGN